MKNEPEAVDHEGNNQTNIEDRLKMLERKSKIQKRILCALFICFLAALLIVFWTRNNSISTKATAQEANINKEIKARMITLVDENGIERISLGASKKASGIYLFDKDGNTRAGLALRNSGSRLILLDKAGNKRALLFSLETASMNLSGLTLQDKAGNTRATFKSGGAGRGLRLYDKEGNVRVGMTSNGKKGGPKLGLYDKDENMIWEAP
jgi:hypothetical protein